MCIRDRKDYEYSYHDSFYDNIILGLEINYTDQEGYEGIPTVWTETTFTTNFPETYVNALSVNGRNDDSGGISIVGDFKLGEILSIIEGSYKDPDLGMSEILGYEWRSSSGNISTESTYTLSSKDIVKENGTELIGIETAILYLDGEGFENNAVTFQAFQGFFN